MCIRLHYILPPAELEVLKDRYTITMPEGRSEAKRDRLYIYVADL